MHGHIVLVSLLVFLGVTHSFGYVIRRKQESSDGSTIEKDSRRVDNQRHKPVRPALQFPDDVSTDKSSVSAKDDTNAIQGFFSWIYDHLSNTINDDDAYNGHAMICRHYKGKGPPPVKPKGNEGYEKGPPPVKPKGNEGYEKGPPPLKPKGNEGYEKGPPPVKPKGNEGYEKGPPPVKPKGNEGHEKGPPPVKPTGNEGYEKGPPPAKPKRNIGHEKSPPPAKPQEKKVQGKIQKNIFGLMDNINITTYLRLAGFEKAQSKPQETEGESEINKEEDYLNAMRQFVMFSGLRVDKELCTHANNLMAHIQHVLMEKSTEKRCGDPDVTKGAFGEEDPVQNPGRKRYTVQSRWEKSELTYKLVDPSARSLSPEVQKMKFAEAFKMWSDAAPGLKITELDEGSTETADISIRFVTGDHGDNVPFDGKGLVVAHAFYPEKGIIHFDDDEDFTTNGKKDTVDLLSVAAHEVGHALGLAHSPSPTSIMYPEYLSHSDNLALSQDDVQGIQNLYPSNVSDCVDQFWCEDILQNECSDFESYCKIKCNVCTGK